MAIEYADNSGESPMPDANNAPEPANDDQGETVDIPVSMLAGQNVSPGDVIRLEVTAVNEDSGTVTAKYATDKKGGSAIDEAASQFEA